MNHPKSIAILNTSLPFSTPNAKDALDVALMMGTYEQQVSIFFIGDGVWQLVENQSPEKLHIKDFLKTFSAFTYYDIENVYVCKKSLSDRGLSHHFHIKEVAVLEQNCLSEKIQIQDVVLRF